MYVRPGILLLSFVVQTYSLSMAGIFCRLKSAKRSFTTIKIVKVKHGQECILHCLSDDQCERFNVKSGEDSLCEISNDEGSSTCNSLKKNNTWDYYDTDCGIVSIL